MQDSDHRFLMDLETSLTVSVSAILPMPSTGTGTQMDTKLRSHHHASCQYYTLVKISILENGVAKRS